MRAVVTALLVGAAICAAARPMRSDLGMEFRADTGQPVDFVDGLRVSGDSWVMQSDTSWGPTGTTPASVQMWTQQGGSELTVMLGVRAVGSAGSYGGLALMACPNCDDTATNAKVNRFEIWDMGMTGVAPAGPTGDWDFDSASIAGSEWMHVAVSYRPENGLWSWYKNGLLQGTNYSRQQAEVNGYAGSWTNGWKPGSVMVLQTTQLPIALPVRMEFDLLAAVEGPLSAERIYQDYLKWNVRRRGLTEDDPFSLDITAVGIPRVVPDATSVSTNADAVVAWNTWDETRFDQFIQVLVTRGAAAYGVSVAGGYDVSGGIILNDEDGTATVTVTATNCGSKAFVAAFELPVEMTSQAESNAVYRTGVPGSLRASASEWVNARVGHGQRSLWNVWNHATTNYQRSTNCWAYAAAGIEATSVWNSRKNSGGVSPTLVAPDLVLGCGHSYPVSNDVIRWVTRDNVVVESTVMAATRLNPAVSYVSWPDLELMRISPAVTNIPYVSIFPTNAGPCIPVHAPGRGRGIPMLKISQTGSVDTLDVYSIQLDGSVFYGLSSDTNRAAYYGPLQGEDSGNPNYIIINGTAVVASVWSTWFYNGTFTGSVSDDWWTAAAVRVGSTNRVTRANLTGFTEY